MPANTPEYKKIMTEYIERIRSSELKPNDMIPPENVLMKQYDVSRITVANAMKKLRDEGWIYRIRGKGTFVSDTVPSSPPDIHSASKNINNEKFTKYKIGIILPTLSDNYTAGLISGIQQAFPLNQYSVFLKFSLNIENEEYCIKEFRSMAFDGIIVFPFDQEIYNDQFLEMKVNKHPFVLIDRYLPGIQTNYCSSDHYLGGVMATKHLLELGHTRIGVCGCFFKETTTQSVISRVNGYKDAIREAGIPIHEEFISHEYKMIELIQSRQITAVIALSENLGITMYDLLYDYNIKVPDDVSLICFDNPIRSVGKLNIFTSIDQQPLEIGKEAGELLKTQIIHKNFNSSKKIIEPKLISGKTTRRLR